MTNLRLLYAETKLGDKMIQRPIAMKRDRIVDAAQPEERAIGGIKRGRRRPKTALVAKVTER